MGSKSIRKSFVNEFVLGFGFLSGLWIYVGINPEAEVMKVLQIIIQQISPNPYYSFLFWLIPTLSTLLAIAGAYVFGGGLGVIAVALAFLGGIFINLNLGIILLILGILLGFIAPWINDSYI